MSIDAVATSGRCTSRKLSPDVFGLPRFSLHAEPECLLGDPLGLMSEQNPQNHKTYELHVESIVVVHIAMKTRC